MEGRLYGVAKDETLLVIAHRLNTIEHCERKIELSWNSTNPDQKE